MGNSWVDSRITHFFLATTLRLSVMYRIYLINIFYAFV